MVDIYPQATLLYSAVGTVRTRLLFDSSGNLYFGAGNYLHGIDYDGSDLSGFPVDMGLQMQDIDVLDDYIYSVVSTIASNNGRVKKHSSSGVQQWDVTGFGIDLHRVIVSDRAYISTDIWGDGTDVFYGLNLETGATEKSYSTCYNSKPQARLLRIEDFMYCFTSTGGPSGGCLRQVRKYNKETVGFITSYTTTADIPSSDRTTDASGNIYFGNDEGRFYKLSSDLGLQWSYPSIGSIGAVQSTPLLNGTKVYFGSNDDKMYCLNVSDGSLAWSYTTGGNVTSLPVVVGSDLFVGSADGYLYIVGKDDGVLVDSQNIGAAITSDMIYVNNVVYFAAGANIYRISAAVPHSYSYIF